MPDFRIQKAHEYTKRYSDMYLCDNAMQMTIAMEDFEYTKWLDPETVPCYIKDNVSSTEAKELVRQKLLEALQNKSGDSVRDLFEIYDKLRTMEPMETGMVINFPSEYPSYDESAYNFQLQSDYLNATNVETFGAGRWSCQHSFRWYR